MDFFKINFLKLINILNVYKEKIKSFDQNTKILIPICLIAILFIGAIIRIIFFFKFKATLFYLYPVLDAQYYDELAQSIAKGHIIQKTAFFMGPFYPYFLGLIYYIFGHSFAIPRIIQMLMGLANITLAYYIGLRVFKLRSAACLAALGIALYRPQIFFEQTLLMEVMVSTFILSVIFLLLWCCDRKNIFWWMLPGFMLGLSALLRGNVILVMFPVMIWIFIVSIKNQNIKNAIFSVMIFFGSVFIGILPATIHNYLAEKDFILITSNSGINFFIGNNEKSEGEFITTDEFDFISDLRGERKAEADLGKKNLKSSELSKYWKNRGIQFIKENPKRFVQLLCLKFYYFWGKEEIPQLYLQDLMAEKIPFLQLPFLSFMLVGPLSIIGIIISLFVRDRNKWLIIIFAVTYILSIIPFFVTDRYRLCIVPVLILFAGYTIPFFFYSFSLKRFYIPIIILISFIVLIKVLNNSEIRKTDFEKAQFCNTMGIFFMKAGQYKDSEEQFKDSLSYAQKTSTMCNLATLYFKHLNKYDLAYKYMKKALEIKPDKPRMNYNMGLVCFSLDKYDEAIFHLKKAAGEPEIRLGLYHNLALLYSKKGDWVQAYINMEQYLKEKPDDRLSFELLLKFYKEAGEFKKGEVMLIEDLKKNPDNVNSLFNLGVFMQHQGKNEEAKMYYEKALKISPQMKKAKEALDNLEKNNMK